MTALIGPIGPKARQWQLQDSRDLQHYQHADIQNIYGVNADAGAANFGGIRPIQSCPTRQQIIYQNSANNLSSLTRMHRLIPQYRQCSCAHVMAAGCTEGCSPACLGKIQLAWSPQIMEWLVNAGKRDILQTGECLPAGAHAHNKGASGSVLHNVQG